jgi:predicted transcriptional regulator
MKTPFFKLRGFKRPQEVIGVSLGPLERQVMTIVWNHGEVSVRDVCAAIEHPSAYTTLMTTLDRLHKKELLARRKEGRAFLYSPRCSPEQFLHGITQDLIHGLLSREDGGAQPVLACFVEAVSERDRALLDDLERLIQEKRRRLQEKE